MKSVIRISRNVSLSLTVLLAADVSPGDALGQAWERTNGPMGAHISAMGFHSSGVIFAGAYLDGIFRSVDDGASWEFVGLSGEEIRGIVEDQAGNVLVGTFTSGVYRSVDLGDTWTSFNLGLTDRRVHSIASDGRGKIIVGTLGTGVFTFDREAEWRSHSDGLVDLDIRSVAFDSEGGAYAASFRSGAFYLPGAGEPWQSLNGGSGISVIRNIVADEGVVVAGGWNGGIAYTRLGDVSWTSINEGLPNQQVWSLGVAPGGRIVAGMHGNGVYGFDEATQTWQSIGLLDNVISAITIRPTGEMWVGARTGIYRSDGVGDTLALRGVPKSVVYAMAQTASGALVAATEQSGTFRSEDGARSWIPSVLQVADVFSLAVAGDVIFAGGSFGALYRSGDDGLSWTKVDRGPGDAWVIDQISSIVIGQDGGIYAGSFGAGVLRSDDNGESWQNGGLPDSEVSSMATAESGLVYAGTFMGVFVTADRGETWNDMNTGLTNTVVRAMWADLDGTLFAGTVGGGLFRLPLGGSSWESYGLDGLVITSIIRGGDGALYAGTYGGGVFQRSGPESEWRAIYEGLTNPYVVSVEWVTNVRGGDALLAGTDGDGVFLLPILANDVEKEPRIAGIENTLVLESNYPNPFSQSTTLSFSIPRAGNVTLRIFDIIGREVADVVSGRLPPGRHTVRWEPSGLAGGTYIYTLTADHRHRSGIMTLAR